MPASGVHRVPKRGHLWTLQPHFGAALDPSKFWRSPPPIEPWSTELPDGVAGAVRLTGDHRRVAGSDALVVLVHGLGGRPNSVYTKRAGELFAEHGFSSLALALRGADRRGDDFYNIALTADLHAALRSQEFTQYRDVYVVGFSMGGHVTLCLGTEPEDSRLRAVVAICTPVHLKTAQLHIDSRHVAFYRRWVLSGLKEIYEANVQAGRRALPSAADAVAAVRTIHQWDTLTIAPRYGYRSPEHYYEDLSVVHRLGQLEVPALLLLVEMDPIIPPAIVMPFLANRPARLDVRTVRHGGHLAFPRSLQLGCGPRPGLIGQLVGWFEQRRSGS